LADDRFIIRVPIRERCLAAGMGDLLTKPVSAAGLLAVIDRLVPAHGVCRPAQAEAGEHIGLLDPVAVLTVCGDDAEALRGMCRALAEPISHHRRTEERVTWGA
jgi:hypothetical protein